MDKGNTTCQGTAHEVSHYDFEGPMNLKGIVTPRTSQHVMRGKREVMTSPVMHSLIKRLAVKSVEGR